MFAALIVGGWPEAAWRCGFKVDALEVTVKREVEIEAGLFTVGDDIKSCA